MEGGGQPVTLEVTFDRAIGVGEVWTLRFEETTWDVSTGVDTGIAMRDISPGGDALAVLSVDDFSWLTHLTNRAGILNGLGFSLDSGSTFLTASSLDFSDVEISHDGTRLTLRDASLPLNADVRALFVLSIKPTTLSWRPELASGPALSIANATADPRTAPPATRSMTRALDALIGTARIEADQPRKENGADDRFERGDIAEGLARYRIAVEHLLLAADAGAQTIGIQATVAEDGRARTDRLLTYLEGRLGSINPNLTAARQLYSRGVAGMSARAYVEALGFFQRAAEGAMALAPLAPRVVDFSRPVDGEPDVRPDVTINVVTREKIDPASVTREALSLINASTGAFVLGSVSLSTDLATGGTVITYAPLRPLDRGRTYAIRVTGAMLNTDGLPMADFQSSFTISASPPPPPTPLTVVSTKPASGDADVPVNASVVVQFNRPIAFTSVNTSTFEFSPPIPVTYAISTDGSFVSMTPTTPLAFSTAYTVVVQNIHDTAGVMLAVPVTVSFTTAASTIGGVIVGTSPTDGATQVSTTSGVMVEATKPLDMTTVTSTTIVLDNLNSHRVTSALVAVGPSAVFMIPVAPLNPNTEHGLTVTTGLKTSAGDRLPANQTSYFWTR